ncbi:ComEC/Rec2 family competence protein [Pyrinomonas methylaliphatogenes]|uniref:Predicted hydrolase (Metallo-beta-lactamase superfamily) n=1 Tax=Pyrinomonas methylaliphatogenes TaxID=454194 RepID=A0A0B6WWJ5_9BACT|nr:ComEC/Rec2 family competence protein [Pyrinomonas methylaliphatogenes]MBX5479055.1 MBL fold metallo-hydrolase [Pyrinomonas methylaliphatogenes]CDM64639.1 predicted hydrolase (metallo-beta-lactamase superfamily) [Pyrinomonas methylaliphatogenes]
MARDRRGCGCLLLFLLIVLGGSALIFYYLIWPKWREKPPPPSGGELQVHVLDVGQGDSILIISPEGKVALIDAGDTGNGDHIAQTMRRLGARAIDLFIASHAHADHIGAADEVFAQFPVKNVLDAGLAPPSRSASGDNESRGRVRTARTRGEVVLPTTKAYRDFLAAAEKSGAEYIKAEPGQRFDLGGGAIITVLAPTEPLFTEDQLRAGGSVVNANSIVARLDYGDFSMLLMGDAEEQTEERLIERGANLRARVLKIGHHGSRYATSERFLRVVRPEIAVISCGYDNRYGHPSQEVLDRLRAANVRVYRTDLQGEITITTRGGKDLAVRTERQATEDVWIGRRPARDDSDRAGFVAYGEFGEPRRKRRQHAAGEGR